MEDFTKILNQRCLRNREDFYYEKKRALQIECVTHFTISDGFKGAGKPQLHTPSPLPLVAHKGPALRND